MEVLFDTILEYIPAPIDNKDESLQFQISLLDYNDYVGRIGIGRVFKGSIKLGQQVSILKQDGTSKELSRYKNIWFFWFKKSGNSRSVCR